MGAFGGAGLGLGLVFLIVYRDSSLKTDDDVTGSLGLPVLALVPMMQTTRTTGGGCAAGECCLAAPPLLPCIGLVGGVAWWVVTRT